METEYQRVRNKVRGMGKNARRLMVKAIATEEAHAAGSGPAYYAWNRVWRAADEAEGLSLEGETP